MPDETQILEIAPILYVPDSIASLSSLPEVGPEMFGPDSVSQAIIMPSQGSSYDTIKIEESLEPGEVVAAPDSYEVANRGRKRSRSEVENVSIHPYSDAEPNVVVVATKSRGVIDSEGAVRKLIISNADYSSKEKTSSRDSKERDLNERSRSRSTSHQRSRSRSPRRNRSRDVSASPHHPVSSSSGNVESKSRSSSPKTQREWPDKILRPIDSSFACCLTEAKNQDRRAVSFHRLENALCDRYGFCSVRMFPRIGICAVFRRPQDLETMKRDSKYIESRYGWGTPFNLRILFPC
jgi:hypothetical protein